MNIEDIFVGDESLLNNNDPDNSPIDLFNEMVHNPITSITNLSDDLSTMEETITYRNFDPINVNPVNVDSVIEAAAFIYEDAIAIVPSADGLYRISYNYNGATGQRTYRTTFSDNPLERFADDLVNLVNRYKDEDIFVDLTSFSVSAMSFTTVGVVKKSVSRGLSGRSEVIASETWYRVDTYTRKNCLFTSLYTGMTWKKEKSKALESSMRRIDGGKRVKNKLIELGFKQKGATPEFDEFDEIATLLNIKLITYNNLYVIQSSYGVPDSDVVVNLLVHNCHALCLIKKSEIKKHRPDFVIPEKIELLDLVGFMSLKQGKSYKGQDEVRLMSDGQYLWGGRVYDTLEDLKESSVEMGYKFVPHKKVLEPEVIDKTKFKAKKYKLNRKIAGYDIESAVKEDDLKGIHHPIMIGFSWLENEEDKYKQFASPDSCIYDFFQYLYEHRNKFRGYVFYAHNGGKFDSYFLLNFYLFNNTNLWKIIEFIESDSSVLLIKIKSADNVIISFLDSLKIASCSLDALCKSLKTPTQKLTGSVELSKLTTSNYKTFFAPMSRYLRNDCISLTQAVRILSKAIYESDGIDMTTCYTGPSLSMKTFWYKYYDQQMYPIYSLPRQMDDFVRSGYFGGRCEAFSLGRTGKCWYYDRVSLYPDVGRAILPYGKPHFVEDITTIYQEDEKLGHVLDKDFYGFVLIEVISTNCGDPSNHELPLFGIKYSKAPNDPKKLVFPRMRTPTLIVEYSETIKYAQNERLSYKYKIKEALSFKPYPILKEFFESNFKERAEAKANGQLGLSMKKKIDMNSLYGKFAQKTDGKESVKIYAPDSSQFIDDYYDQRLKYVRFTKGYLVICKNAEGNDKESNVAISAAITSNGRVEIHKMISLIRKHGGWVHYCDTDSIISNLDISKIPELFKKLVPDGEGKALGSLKNELPEKLKDHFEELFGHLDEAGKKEVWKQAADEDYAFQDGSIVMPKAYCLMSTYKNVNFTSTAFKGLSTKFYELTMDDFDNLMNGETFLPFGKEGDDDYELQEEEYKDNDEGPTKKRKVMIAPKGQLSFIGGKRALMTSSEEDAGIRVSRVKKRFRMVYSKGNYTPGLKSQQVFPLVI